MKIEIQSIAISIPWWLVIVIVCVFLKKIKLSKIKKLIRYFMRDD